MRSFFIFQFLLIVNLVNAENKNKSYTDTTKKISGSERNLQLSGTLCATSVYHGGIDRDDRNVKPIPLQKFTLYVVSLNSVDSIPKIVKSFTTDENGEFSVSLPPGKYGFVTTDEAQGTLLKGQCLPKETETTTSHTIRSSTWVCNKACPLELSTTSIEKLVITNHISSFCMNCQ